MNDCDVIKAFRNIVVPAHANRLLNLNFEDMGQQDKEEYERDANRILDLAQERLDLADWLADRIFDEDFELEENKENNWPFFCELACRKLEKLGVVKREGNMWKRVNEDGDEL